MSVVEQEQVGERAVELDTAGRELVRAAEIVRERWGQGDELLNSSKRCAFTSLTEAQGGDVYGGDGFKTLNSEALHRFKDSLHLEVTAIYRWNDTTGRTAEEVATALERAAYGL